MVLLHFLFDHIEFFAVLAGVIIAFVLVRAQLISQKQAEAELLVAIANGTDQPRSLHPSINPDLCTGCGVCTRVCPEGDILKIANGRATLVAPQKCVSHGECARSCPYDAITMVLGIKSKGLELPILSLNYESNVSGLYIAGELGGMGLISNAVKQGVLAAGNAVWRLQPEIKTDYDVVIIGAGPAGFAAGLALLASGKSYLVVEQNTFGGTIANYPRQKIVMSNPVTLPIVGEVKFKKNRVSKEEMIERWMEIRNETGLQIQEGTRFESLTKAGNYFLCKTSDREFTAQKIILCLGTRGLPRRLGLKNEDLSKVAYQLDDAREFREKHIMVVGGGNAAAEAAQALGRPELGNKVTVLVRRDTLDTANDANRDATLAMAQAGHLDIWFSSELDAIEHEEVTVRRGRARDRELVKVRNDQIFIFAGSEMPTRMLKTFGIDFKIWRGEAMKAG